MTLCPNTDSCPQIGSREESQSEAMCPKSVCWEKGVSEWEWKRFKRKVLKCESKAPGVKKVGYKRRPTFPSLVHTTTLRHFNFFKMMLGFDFCQQGLDLEGPQDWFWGFWPLWAPSQLMIWSNWIHDPLSPNEVGACCAIIIVGQNDFTTFSFDDQFSVWFWLLAHFLLFHPERDQQGAQEPWSAGFLFTLSTSDHIC